MKITKIEYIKTLRPNMSCGTGYSEPDKFKITCDDNLYKNDIWHEDSFEKEIWIDIWYLTEDSAEKEFVKSIKRNFGNIENFPEAFEMYKEALRSSSTCPYYWAKKK